MPQRSARATAPRLPLRVNDDSLVWTWTNRTPLSLGKTLPYEGFLLTCVVNMLELKQAIADVPDFPRPGILFRDISPLLRDHFGATVQALDALLTEEEWSGIDALAGIESRGFILGAALAMRRGKGFVLVRKQGKLPPPVVDVSYDLEYGSGVLEMQSGRGRVVLIDDVLATGGTMTASADLCHRAGYQLQALLALIDLNIVRNYSWRNLRLRAVINY
jgi:adenine phosphoribosyltransferase